MPHPAIRQYAIVASVLLMHLVILCTLFSLTGDEQAMLIAGWAFAAGGLCTLWWVGPAAPRLMIRTPLAVAGMAATWAILVDNVPADFQSNESLAWASAFIVQATIVAAALVVARLVRRVWRADADPPPLSRFGLGALLLWVGVAALFLGAGRAIAVALGWTIDVVAWEYFLHLQLFGVYNAVFTLLVRAALSGRRWVLLQVLFAMAIAAGVAASLTPLLTLLFTSPGIDQATALLVFAVECAVLLATLAPLQWLRPPAPANNAAKVDQRRT